ncbi:hypothetical protein DPMN_054931 [Dreissena polymorpha]|uniref:Uncharacterized protein n=1 Tax=Dreissena polymorpha TaxID=45954 RepID=A0A9D4HTJ9_DREPO|nr:hypothetical protein DPMN_054931 [Dreissena polymorpha]
MFVLKVICTKFPKMETVVDRLLDIYFLLSAGNHQGALDDAMAMQEESVGKFLTRDGRLISTRYVFVKKRSCRLKSRAVRGWRFFGVS